VVICLEEGAFAYGPADTTGLSETCRNRHWDRTAGRRRCHGVCSR